MNLHLLDMEKCSYGLAENDNCAGEHFLVSSLANEAPIPIVGNRLITNVTECPNVGTTEGWLVSQRVALLTKESLLCSKHRQELAPRSSRWLNLGKKCYYPEHEHETAGKKRSRPSKSSLRNLSLPELMNAGALFPGHHIPFGAAICCKCRNVLQKATIDAECNICFRSHG